MRYMGGKVKMAKYLYPHMASDIERLGRYWEPFVGGGGMLVHVAKHAGTHVKMMASDSFIPVVELLRKVGQGWTPPTTVAEELYRDVKSNKDAYPLELQGFLATACSFAGRPWEGYARCKRGDNYAEQGSAALVRGRSELARATYAYGDYRGFILPADKTVIYCDPPYCATKGYGGSFDSAEFYAWCRSAASDGHIVYVSEYSAPEDFELVFEKERRQGLRHRGGAMTKTECLYRVSR